MSPRKKDLRPRVHRRVPPAAPGREAGRRVVDGRRRPRAPPVEPRQGVLARRGLHQGRPARLLLQRRRADPAPPARAPAHDEAHARRDLGAVLLREDGAVPHARLDRPLSGPQRREQGRRHRVPDGERPRHAAVRRQPRLHRDAPAALAVLDDRDARLPLLRPRPHGCELRGRPHRRAPRPSGARGAGADGLPEDVRRDRRADLRARSNAAGPTTRCATSWARSAGRSNAPIAST